MLRWSGGPGVFSMKNGGVSYETCILTYPDVSCVYPDVSSRILYPERILTYSVRILCEPLYSGQDTFLHGILMVQSSLDSLD